jgi:RNA polymerase sigma-70 factor (ECF subfamily)
MFYSKHRCRPAPADATLSNSVVTASEHLQSSDAELVQAIGQGDRLAFATLYDRYAGAMLAAAARMFGNRSEAEDLLHDLFVEVSQESHKFDESRGSVRAWLFLRLRSRACDRLRSHARARVAAIDEIPEGMVPPAELSIDRVRLGKALHGMSPADVLLLEQVYVAGHSLTEIAEHTTTPIGTIKSRLNRALAHLRETFAGNTVR